VSKDGVLLQFKIVAY